MRRLLAAGALLALYIALTGNLQPSNIALGAVVAALIALLLPLRSGPVAWQRLPIVLLEVALYVAILARDVIRNGLVAGRMILDPRLPIRPGILAIPTRCCSELAAALSAHAMTVAPGELVVGIGEDGVMYTHTLDTADEEQYVAEASSRRQELLQRIFP